tara:strand:+ start:5234 stop:5854 length:621 start_codon:yes stop_codon:yes gene_type:complete
MKMKKLKQRKVLIIGAGGLGSYLSSFMARISENRQPLYDITIFDDDKVEEKNLSYQNFKVEDIGNFKVKVLDNTLGINSISSKEEYQVLTSKQMQGYDLVICCVDNLAARRLMYKEGHGEDCPVKWLDLRAQGRNGVLISYKVNPQLIVDLLSGADGSFSCQGGEWDGSAKDISAMHIAIAGIATQWIQRWFNDNNDVTDMMVLNV